jgi:hypothetical protein
VDTKIPWWLLPNDTKDTKIRGKKSIKKIFRAHNQQNTLSSVGFLTFLHSDTSPPLFMVLYQSSWRPTEGFF